MTTDTTSAADDRTFEELVEEDRIALRREEWMEEEDDRRIVADLRARAHGLHELAFDLPNGPERDALLDEAEALEAAAK